MNEPTYYAVASGPHRIAALVVRGDPGNPLIAGGNPPRHDVHHIYVHADECSRDEALSALYQLPPVVVIDEYMGDEVRRWRNPYSGQQFFFISPQTALLMERTRLMKFPSHRWASLQHPYVHWPANQGRAVLRGDAWTDRA